MTKIVVTRVPVDRPGTMLLVRFGVVMGVSLLTAAGWLVLEMERPEQRVACLAALRAHYPEVLGPEELAPEALAGPEVMAGCDGPRQASRVAEAESVAPRAGFEPATNRLTAGCSTTELPGNTCRSGLPHGQGRAYIRASERVKAEMQEKVEFDVVYPDRGLQNPRSAVESGANGAGERADRGRGFLVVAAAGAVDGAGRAGGAVGRFAARATLPAAQRSEDLALVARTKKKGPERTGPEVWVMVGCLHGKTRGILARDG